MNPLQFEQVIGRLGRWRDELVERLKSCSDAERDGLVAEKVRLEAAMECLRLCEQSGIGPGAQVQSIPYVKAGYYDLHLMCDCESSDVQLWREMTPDGRLVKPGKNHAFDIFSGDLVVRLARKG